MASSETKKKKTKKKKKPQPNSINLFVGKWKLNLVTRDASSKKFEKLAGETLYWWLIVGNLFESTDNSFFYKVNAEIPLYILKEI